MLADSRITYGQLESNYAAEDEMLTHHDACWKDAIKFET
jgi:hypothetical protein